MSSTKEITLEQVKDPNCSPEVLVKVLRMGKNDIVFQGAVNNPNCPPEMLAEILRREAYDWVSWHAANNPNCPQRAAIRWRMATGQITKEDPRIHYIEKSKEDEDLKKLKQLIEPAR